MNELTNPQFESLIETVTAATIKAVLSAQSTHSLEDAIAIRNELHRLPDFLITEVLNRVMLNLVQIDPILCRWFILDVFLRDADPEGKADVAERLNLLLADLKGQ